jgi:hypothetical protein
MQIDFVGFSVPLAFQLVRMGYMVTSNHVHLLVKDTGANVIAESMQLIAGRTRGSWFKVQGSMVQG